MTKLACPRCARKELYARTAIAGTSASIPVWNDDISVIVAARRSAKRAARRCMASWIVTLVLALLSHGCPLQAIVFAFGIDVRADELGGLTARALAAGEPSEARRSLSAGCAC